ncbi:hypothetical protein GCM10010149_16160 [Nonomuraea roseoviolacea subsp. roseoviolacea]|uniref:DUF1996 domain-containing protein n=1 Tax=Nonomuraea roseoviolacea TaxID=103837 RepID=UPI0031CF9150
MRGASRGRPFRPWLTLFGGIVLVLATGPSPQQGAGVLRLSGAGSSAGANSAETIVCPGVADRLPAVPAAAREEVDRNLALLEKQIAEANARLASSAGEGGPNFVRNAILGPLEDKRAAAIDRIAIAIGRVAARPTGLDGLAACSLSTSGTPGSSATATATATATASAAADPAAIGPTADDFVDIRQVARAEQPRSTGRGSRGTFLSRCGVPGDSHANEDDLIVAPGVQDGAQQLIDYVGNTTTDAFSTNESLAASTTTCANRADRSTYFWPVLRTRATDEPDSTPTSPAPTVTGTSSSTGTGSSKRTGTGAEAAPTAPADPDPSDPDATDLPTDVPTDLGPTDLPPEAGATDLTPDPGTTDLTPDPGTTDPAPDDTLSAQPDAASTAQADSPRQAAENNVGTPVEPVAVRVQYRGNPTSRVTAMPRFLRLLSGDPRALTNGDDNVRAAWSCTGFTDRLTDKYPICPSGSRLVRVHDMPSCWDGENTDSATHRAHLVFPGEDGACPSGTRAVPQLRLTLVYGELPTTRPEGTDVPFALDSFASERHAPRTAHAGAVVVMSDRLMRTVVTCINTGRNCFT